MPRSLPFLCDKHLQMIFPRRRLNKPESTMLRAAATPSLGRLPREVPKIRRTIRTQAGTKNRAPAAL